MHPVSFAGRSLRDFEKRFATHKKEALALIEAIKKNRSFLRNQEFTVYTDSRTLTFLKNLKADAGRLGRWSILLQDYRFILKHTKKSENVVADSLSRRSYPPEKERDDNDNEFCLTDVLSTHIYLTHRLIIDG